MKRSHLKIGLILVLSVACFTACYTDENKNGPIEKNGIPPRNVSEVQVTNLTGKVELRYKLPPDQDLLYVKAEYVLDNGTKMEVKASYYKSVLLLEGFAKSGEREVKLYTVNRSEAVSEPLSVVVNPKPSPLFDVFASLDIGPAFGGVFINALNVTRSEVAILVMKKDNNGDWQTTVNSIYTSTDKIAQRIRGLDTIPYQYAFTVRDRFLNTSDTLVKTIKPFFETEIPRNKYVGYKLPGDAPIGFGTTISGMFDNDYRNWPKLYITEVTYPGPHSFTLDLSQQVKLSRVKIWDYPQYSAAKGFEYYYQFNMRNFEIWGSNNPSPDGSYASWELLGTYEVVKPSGLPYGQQTDEDLRFASAGFDWEIPISAPKYRYLRIKNLKNWADAGRLAISEMRVYGDTR
jgi:Domain of unknown function/Domain of unknown function (DUF4959)/Domain of unknown function (DUF5126)